ncbi:hypothetical protein G6O69_26635 [Pseudenhygromyxa sp. WMMC2535]|uniref:hypothetical protein n=1 Tax=Pseudenhygromyxa sp. WMMC2535 TaxID=2712867 RepID=UPI001552A5BB|nr:hypothetical protein [Pseudenhygromyxa sp. WMMC2535]NVB41444.1 hypothetical protein [Pseudenhygromyxa sp. WMMC2535]
MRITKSTASASQRKGKKSKRWRAHKRMLAEAEAASRKRARDAKARGQQLAGEDAATRFEERRALFRARHGKLGGLAHALASLTHNCLAHPLLGLLPCRLTVWLHDRSADWLNLSAVVTCSGLPEIPDRRAWLVHNCLAHPLMGLAPLRRALDAHERSAERMRVEGWV